MKTPPHSRPRISLVITDLDNTLYDWVTFFVQSFYDMLLAAAPLLEVSDEELADQLRVVHQRHHNSEHPFALLETEAARIRFPDLTRKARAAALDAAFQAFNAKQKETLALYPGVLEALGAITDAGAMIVGHTEATVPNALFRLKVLGIAPLLRKLYAVEPSGDGHPDPAIDAALRDDGPPVRYLGHDERKPDPRVIRDICEEFGVPPERTLYVGDSISRDIGMAREAGAYAAWAQYGTRYDNGLWQQLVRVTHWTTEDVRRAESARARYGDAEPHVVLDTSFDQLLLHFDFAR